MIKAKASPRAGMTVAARLSRWISALVLAGFAGSLLAEGIEIESLTSRLHKGVYLVDAQILYQPSKTILDALEHGVPLTFEVKLDVRRKDAWIWERTVARHRLRYSLRYHALVSRYEVFLPDKKVLRYATLEAALRALGGLSDLSLVESASLESDEEYELHLGIELDIESLPVPLRPRAYLSSDWSLSYEHRPWLLIR